MRHERPLFDWYDNGDTPPADGSAMRISRTSAGYVRPMWAGVGSMVIGRQLFDITNGWEREPRRPRPGGRGGDGRRAGCLRLSKRYFGSVDAQQLLDDPHTVIAGDRVLHLRYRVRR